MKSAVTSFMRIGIIGLIALTIGVSGCRHPATADRTSGQVAMDKETEKNVKKALADAPVFKYPDVQVGVYDGSVQLTGFVSTQEQRAYAADIAAKTKGVTQVINQIMIKPTPTGRTTVRDPLGRETGKVMIDTNAPAPQPMKMDPLQPNPGSEGAQPAPQENQPAPEGSKPQ